MFKFLKKLFTGDAAPSEAPTEAPYKVEPPVLDKVAVVNAQPLPVTAPVESAPRRAKDSRGKFIADDPNTPENEAWVGGVAPARKKPAAKKPAVKKPAVIKAPAKKKTGR